MYSVDGYGKVEISRCILFVQRFQNAVIVMAATTEFRSSPNLMITTLRWDGKAASVWELCSVGRVAKQTAFPTKYDIKQTVGQQVLLLCFNFWISTLFCVSIKLWTKKGEFFAVCTCTHAHTRTKVRHTPARTRHRCYLKTLKQHFFLILKIYTIKCAGPYSCQSSNLKKKKRHNCVIFLSGQILGSEDARRFELGQPH